MTLGWGRGTCSVVLSATLIVLFLFTTHSTAHPCKDPILEAATSFDTEWTANFSRYPGLVDRLEDLKSKLLAQKALNPDVRAHLENAGHPLAVGSRHAYRAMQLAFLRFIDEAELEAERAAALKTSLQKAVDTLTAALPKWESEEGPAEPEPSKEVVDEIYKDIQWEATKRCITRTSILFVASNTINTAGALQAKWKQYAGEDAKLVDGVMKKATWDKAFEDPEFRHNMTWNAIMMTSLGGLSCIQHKKLRTGLVSGLALACSLTGQYLSTGTISITQTVLDVLFVRYISLNKSNLVFNSAEWYTRRGLPLPLLVEGSLQLLSEGVGAYLYPRAVTANKWLWSSVTEQILSPEPSP